MNLAQFPAEILCKIAIHSKWSHIREVCRDFRAKIDPVSISRKFLSAVHVIRYWPKESVVKYMSTYNVELYRGFGISKVFPLLSNYIKSITVLHFAAIEDRVDLLEEFYKPGDEMETYMLASCISGSTNAVKYYVSFGESIAGYCTIPDGCLDILELKNRDCQGLTSAIPVEMLESGKLANFKYVMVNGFRIDAQVQCAAARLGLVNILKWMDSLGTRFTEEVINTAVKAGKIEAVKYLHSVKCPMNEKSCERAAKWGHFEILQLLKEWGCPWGPRATELAVRGHQWNILKWLLDSGCPVDAKTLRAIHNTHTTLRIVSEIFRQVKARGVKFVPDVELSDISDEEDLITNVKKMVDPPSDDSEEADEADASGDESGEEDD